MGERIGILGLGLLGSALAGRLVRAGYRVAGFDPRPECREEARALGAEAAASGRQAAAGSRFLLTCVPDGPTTRRALLEEGAAAALAPGAVVIDCGTGSPAESRKLEESLRALGLRFVEAPVSGSSEVVRQGRALLLVGGREEAWEPARPVLEALAPRLLRTGEAGSASACKLVTNLVLGLNRLALAEGLLLAERAGLEPDTVIEALRSGAAYSRALDAKAERMVRRAFLPPEARLVQHLKDVELILALAEEAGLRLPASRLHRELLEEGTRMGLAEADNAAVIEVLAGRSTAAGTGSPPASGCSP